jgi:alkylation response protein AidB-like acyl-CoA dehydrogenase
VNFADRDPALRPLLERLLREEDRARIEPLLAELGELAATELDQLAATADKNPPQLRQYAPDGQRIDEVEFHPAYERLAEVAFGKFGLASMSHRPGVLGWPGTVPHVVKYTLSYLLVQAEFGLACPVSMTDSAARVLRRFDPDRFAAEIGALTSTDPAKRATGAMFMTEIAGGTDVGQTATTATDQGTHWTLTGRKWFASNVSADVILTLARVPGQGDGTSGLGMFCVPRVRPDGTRNSYRIDRLKDKLGSRSMASGEVTLEGAYAQPVGSLANGFRQMAEMVNVSRLSNAMRAAALMRRAVTESVAHTRDRIVFGKPLFDQPLMRATLLPMILDTEAALGLVLECAELLQRADDGTGTSTSNAKRLIRVLTPLAKYTVCKQARLVTGEAMEIRGGNGYIEDWVNPRLLRDAHLGSIWEGSSNVIALDVLRCLRRDAAHQALAAAYRERLNQLEAVHEAAALVRTLTGRWEALRVEGDTLLAQPDASQQVRIAPYAMTVTRTVMATLLTEQAVFEARRGANGQAGGGAGRGDGYRKLLVAAAYVRRLADPDAIPESALEHLPELADGGFVPAEAASDVTEPVPPAAR